MIIGFIASLQLDQLKTFELLGIKTSSSGPTAITGKFHSDDLLEFSKYLHVALKWSWIKDLMKKSDAKKINFNFNNLTNKLSHLYWNILKISQKKEPKDENNGEENEMITMKWMNK